MENFDYRSILVDSGSIGHCLHPVPAVVQLAAGQWCVGNTPLLVACPTLGSCRGGSSSLFSLPPPRLASSIIHDLLPRGTSSWFNRPGRFAPWQRAHCNFITNQRLSFSIIFQIRPCKKNCLYARLHRILVGSCVTHTHTYNGS